LLVVRTFLHMLEAFTIMTTIAVLSGKSSIA
jgi:hypothetical protein